MLVFNLLCIIKELRDTAHARAQCAQDTQTQMLSSILSTVCSNILHIWPVMASSRTSRGQEETLSVMKGRKGKWLPSYFVDVKLTVLRWDEVSGMCVTVACLTPEQLGICSRVFMSLSHILCCQWCRSLLPVHKHSFKYCACERSRSLNAVCVCLGFMSPLVSRPNRQGDSSGVIGGRSFCSVISALLCYLCSLFP